MKEERTFIGVGIDTARYAHHVSFVGPERQPLAKALKIGESAEGYEQLRQQLEKLQRAYPNAHLSVRIDAAGQYASNLDRFLRDLPFPMTISTGEPKRNRDYHRAVFPKRKADATESCAMARFAAVEQPPATPPVPEQFILMREIAGRLQAQARDTTRAKNRFHNLLARVFPELEQVVPDVTATYMLTLLKTYPTPERIARAKQDSLTKIPYLTEEKAAAIQAAAQRSIGSLSGQIPEALMRAAVEDICHHQKMQKHLEKMLLESSATLPESGHRQVATIPGIGPATAAVLVTKIVSIERFATPRDLVGYFGIFPEEDSSGVTARGEPNPSRTRRMSRKGNDLVRGYLWNAAQSASRSNPAVRSLYARLRSRGTRGDVALGHCMRKLLHLVFALWTTDRPFDPKHYPWEPAPADQGAAAVPANGTEKAAGHKREVIPAREVVTATTSNVAPPNETVKRSGRKKEPSQSVDFAWLREQIPLRQVLDYLGCWNTLRDAGKERRGPCPLHGSKSPTSRTFAVNTTKNTFYCHGRACKRGGNVIDFWMANTGLSAHAAAVDLARIFNVPLRPEQPEQKRRGARNLKHHRRK